MQDAGPDAEARSVPARRALRNVLRQAADDFADERGLTAPLSLCQLRRYADELIAQTQQDPEHRDFLAILIHNATWRATVAAIPYDKRLLLLPQCLKHSTDCEGHLDEFLPFFARRPALRYAAVVQLRSGDFGLPPRLIARNRARGRTTSRTRSRQRWQRGRSG